MSQLGESVDLGRLESVLGAVGRTPIVRLRRVVDRIRTPVWLKLESFNPGGSVKDRIGLAIIEQAEADGTLRPGGTVVEGTAGNTGLALAFAAAVKGYRCVFAIPDKMSAEKISLVRAFGAEVIVTPSGVPPDHPNYYSNVARRLAEETPGAVLADQFFNPANPRAHYRTTGPEVWKQTDGRVTHFVAAPATGGTISGVGRYLKEQKPGVKVIAADPAGSVLAGYARTGEVGKGDMYKVEGAGNDKIPGAMDFSVIDEFMTVPDRDAFQMARRLTRQEALFAGGASGLIGCAALRIAERVDDPEACIVGLVTDSGERYLSKIYSDEWMRENRMTDTSPATAAGMMERKAVDGVPALIAVGPGDTVAHALDLMGRHHVSQLPVVETGRQLGSASEARLMAAVIADPARRADPVSDHADDAFPEIGPDAGLKQMADLMTRRVTAVAVISGGSVAGILTRHDILRRLLAGDGGSDGA